MAVGLVVDRPSNAGPGVGIDPRRSSAFGSKPSGPKQDPRPLTSKDYQASCIRTVISYLSTHNFPAAVSPKTLASPTGKDFATIVTFLFQQVDPTFRIQGKVEDEVPVFFKRLNYPFQISKSALFAVGSPHSWPGVLAALTWLVELLNYTERADDSSGPAFERENKVEQDFLDYLAAGYGAFMSGNDERCEALDSELAAKFTAREGDLDARCERLKKSNADAAAELERLRALPDPVVAAQAAREEQLLDGQKFEQLIQNLQGLKQTLTRKLSEKKADLSARQDQIAGAVAEVEGLRQRVAGQTVNKADLNRMIMERHKQQEMLDSEKAKCADMECKVHEQEVQMVRTLTGLDATVERYNKLAHRLKLVPASSKRADGTNYELRVYRDAGSQAEFANLDLKGVVKPGLERLCEAYRTRASELAQDLISLREARVARAERNAEKQEENAALEAEISRLEAQLQAAKDAHEDKCRRLVAQAEGIKAQVDEFRSAASNRSEHMEERLARAQAAYEQAKRDSEAELSRLEADLKAAMALLVGHREALAGAVGRAAAAVRAVKAELLAAPGLPQHHMQVQQAAA
ncbi:hypothetical protein HYH03_017455 [Edaphochlamys debaryana]|uniref:Kinetochore protein NDC80 n=1 Tax=Edaphochlamys debaryana TaxID=47281 RepID=A0A835XIB8_9CHLO|nr:hypothetical protein HYH03_017455 [Edaphochlamys debaryana]|eukprot:KAG2483652.1 hypothetical protein HYH03_017455 [Edaphochlamys debaryana]